MFLSIYLLYLSPRPGHARRSVGCSRHCTKSKSPQYLYLGSSTIAASTSKSRAGTRLVNKGNGHGVGGTALHTTKHSTANVGGGLLVVSGVVMVAVTTTVAFSAVAVAAVAVKAATAVVAIAVEHSMIGWRNLRVFENGIQLGHDRGRHRHCQ